ncbi:MAG TPA: oxidoreductase [Verrucomicrobia bacterium]|nr:oxidoreductase [Verrucomicrobiota bacterium]
MRLAAPFETNSFYTTAQLSNLHPSQLQPKTTQSRGVRPLPSPQSGHSVGFGIIGAGNIARFHARALQEGANTHLAGIYSDIPDMTDRLAAEFGCQAFRSKSDFFAAPQIQAVTIATPSGTHADLCVEAAEAGKHVMCEKPLEITLPRIDSIIEACDRAGVLLGAIFQSRFGRGAQIVHQLISSGALGRRTISNAQIKWFRTQAYYDSGGWRGTWELDGGGALMNQGIHAIDLLVWMCGLPNMVYAKTGTIAHQRIEVEDVAVATLQWPDGSLGWLEGTTAAYPGRPKRLELSGDKGTVILEDDTVTFLDLDAPSPDALAFQKELESAQTSIGGGASDPLAIDYSGHKLQFEDLARAIDQGGQPAVHGREARKAVALILAIYQSARENRPIDPRSL